MPGPVRQRGNKQRGGYSPQRVFRSCADAGRSKFRLVIVAGLELSAGREVEGSASCSGRAAMSRRTAAARPTQNQGFSPIRRAEVTTGQSQRSAGMAEFRALALLCPLIGSFRTARAIGRRIGALVLVQPKGWTGGFPLRWTRTLPYAGRVCAGWKSGKSARSVPCGLDRDSADLSKRGKSNDFKSGSGVREPRDDAGSAFAAKVLALLMRVRVAADRSFPDGGRALTLESAGR